MKTDGDRWLRALPLAVGGLVGSGLMINRLLTSQLLPSQARSDIAGVIACAVLVLTGLLWQRVQPKTPESVVLVGVEGLEISADLSDLAQTELAWASHLLLTNTATRSIVVYYQGQTILRRGVLASNAIVVPGVILERVLKTHQPVYLVNLKIYPGRIEFNYLPENTQGIICQPIGDQGVLILAANAPRSYTQQDEIWIAGIADKLAITLSDPLRSNLI
jgi:hypothetical protein